MKSKKALSGIVTSVILIALAVVAVIIVTVVVKNLSRTELNEAKKCLDIYDKLKINPEYTCYDGTSGELKVSIGLQDISPEKILLSISTPDKTKTFELKDFATYSYVKMSEGIYGNSLQIPGANEGLSYVINVTDSNVGITEKPSMIKIAPVMDGKTCDVVDSFPEIPDCSELA